MSTNIFKVSDFNLVNDNDFLRVDSLCIDLLKDFYSNIKIKGVKEPEASRFAKGVDYFIRDFVVDKMLQNPFLLTSELVRQFAATWYIVVTPEPSDEELQCYLESISAFAAYLHDKGYISNDNYKEISAASQNLSYYKDRIESFWKVEPGGYNEWEKEVKL